MPVRPVSTRRRRRAPGDDPVVDVQPSPDHAARKAVLYARVSSTEQEVEGFSIDAQRKLLRDYAAAHDLLVVNEYVDVETAKKAGRTRFEEMLAFLRGSEDVNVLLVEKTDRLYRNIRDWVTLDDMSLEIHLVKEGGVLSEESRSHEKFIHGIKVLMAKNYIDNLSEETRKGMLEKARQGHWPSHAPLGYLNARGADGKNTIVVDPVRGPVVTELFEQYATGQVALSSLLKLAADRGLVTKKGAPLSLASLHFLLQNPLYMGHFQWKGEWFAGLHEPLVDEATWNTCQDVLDERARLSHRPVRMTFAYGGLLRCGACSDEGTERLLTGSMVKETYVYYACARCRRKGRAIYFRETDIDREMKRALDGLHLPEPVLGDVRRALLESFADLTADREENRKRLEDRHRQLQRQVDVAYRDRLVGRISGEVYDRLAASWRAEQEEVQQQLAQLTQADEQHMRLGVGLLEIATKAGRAWLSMDDAHRRDFLGFLCANSRLWSGRMVVEWRKPFDLLPQSPWAQDKEKAVFGDENGPSSVWLPRLFGGGNMGAAGAVPAGGAAGSAG
jgi:DNA invertase Pin-like site-specific DNA recombinase